MGVQDSSDDQVDATSALLGCGVIVWIVAFGVVVPVLAIIALARLVFWF